MAVENRNGACPDFRPCGQPPERKKLGEFIRIGERGEKAIDMAGFVKNFIHPIGKKNFGECVKDLLEDKAAFDLLLHLCDLGKGQEILEMLSERYSLPKPEAEKIFNAAYSKFYNQPI